MERGSEAEAIDERFGKRVTSEDVKRAIRKHWERWTEDEQLFFRAAYAYLRECESRESTAGIPTDADYY